MHELKKINLRKASNFLSEAEMKRVTGGFSSGTCAAKSPYQTCQCDVSKAEAIHWACCDSSGDNCNGGYWCCDSCGSASWYSGCCG